MMYGQMTAGSWIYIGSQGIVQGTYETFAEAGRQHYGGDLAGRWILTAGLGGMGGAQPLAATFAGAVSLIDRMPAVAHRFPSADPVSRQAGKRSRHALDLIEYHCDRRDAVSIGLLGNAAEILPGAGEARQGERKHPARRW